MSKVELDCAIHDAFYGLKRINCLFDSTYARYFGEDPEEVHGMGDESFRQFYEEVQLSLQGIAELLNGAVSSAEQAVNVFDHGTKNSVPGDEDKVTAKKVNMALRTASALPLAIKMEFIRMLEAEVDQEGKSDE